MDLDPFALYALATFGALVVLAAVAFAYTRPLLAVPVASLMILLADTQFRLRDPTAALAGDVDAQIVWELGLYGFLGLLAAVLLMRSGRPSLRLLEISVVGYACLCIASVLWSRVPIVSLARSCQLLVLVVLSYAVVRVAGSERTVRALAVSCTLYVAVCAAFVVLMPQLHIERADGRLGWFAVPPISAASYAAIAALLLLSLGTYGERGWRSRVLWCPVWLFPLPLIAVLLATGSRGPLLAFLGGVGVLVLKRLQAHAAIVLVLLGILGAVTVLGTSATLAELLAEAGGQETAVVGWLLRGQTAEQFLGMTGRAELWANVIGHFYQQPIQGYGYQASRSFLLDTARWAGHAHNAYLQTLLEVGLAGAALLFTPMVVAFTRSFRRTQAMAVRWDEAAVLGAMIFLMLNSITDESFAVPGYQLMVTLVCLVVTARRANPPLIHAARARAVARGTRTSRVPIGAARTRTGTP